MSQADIEQLYARIEQLVGARSAKRLFENTINTEDFDKLDVLANLFELEALQFGLNVKRNADDVAHLLCNAYDLVSSPALEHTAELATAASLFTGAGYSAKAATVLRYLLLDRSNNYLDAFNEYTLQQLAEESYAAIITRRFVRCAELSTILLSHAPRAGSTWLLRFATILAETLITFGHTATPDSARGAAVRTQDLSSLLTTSAMRSGNEDLYHVATRIAVALQLFFSQSFPRILQEEQINLSEKYQRRFLTGKEGGTPELWPSQQAAIKAGALSKPSFVVSLPTSSGKTLLAQLRIARFLETNPTGSVIYVSPYIALSNQVLRELHERFSPIGISVHRFTGAYELEMTPTPAAQIVVTTPEKLDALLRRVKPNSPLSILFKSLGLLILDECHHVSSGARGTTFELLVARLQKRYPNLDIFAMSASAGNVGDLATWLTDRSDSFIKNDWAPTRRRVYFYKRNGDVQDLEEHTVATLPKWRDAKNALSALCSRLIEANAWPILILSTRKSAALSFACALGESLDTEKLVPASTDDSRGLIASRLKSKFGSDSLVLNAVRRGIALHSTSVPDAVREDIEDAVRDRHIRIVSATTTLAEGVHLPFKSVIIPYLNFTGNERIERPLFLNIIGRAGRAFTNIEATVVVLEPEAEALKLHFRQSLAPSMTSASRIESTFLRSMNGQTHTANLRFKSQILGAIQDGHFEERLLEELPARTLGWRQGNLSVRKLIQARTNESVADLRSASIQFLEKGRLALTPLGTSAAMSGLAGESVERLYHRLQSLQATGRPWFNREHWLEDTLSPAVIEDITSLVFTPVEAIDHLFDPGNKLKGLRAWAGLWPGSNASPPEPLSEIIKLSRDLLDCWISGNDVMDFGRSIAPSVLTLKARRKPDDIAVSAQDYIEADLIMLQWMISGACILTEAIAPELQDAARRSLVQLQYGTPSRLAVRLIRFGLDRHIANRLSPEFLKINRGTRTVEIVRALNTLRHDQSSLLSQSDWAQVSEAISAVGTQLS